MTQAMTREEVYFCANILQGKFSLARELIPQIEVVPKGEVSKENNYFRYLPSIFLLWAQDNPEAALKALQKYYPEQLASVFANQLSPQPCEEDIHNLVRELIFPLVKSYLIPFLHNISLLLGSDPGAENERLCFYLKSATAALDLILTDDYFDDMGLNKEALARTIHEKLKQFEEKLTPNTVKSKLELTKDTQPDAIKHLMAILNGSPSTTSHPFSGPKSSESLDLHQVTTSRPSFLPSGGADLQGPRIAERLEVLTQQLAGMRLRALKEKGNKEIHSDPPSEPLVSYPKLRPKWH